MFSTVDMSAGELATWLESLPLTEVARIQRVCGERLLQAALRAGTEAENAAPLTPALAARRLGLDRSTPRKWVADGLVRLDEAGCAPWGLWRDTAASRRPGRPRKAP